MNSRYIKTNFIEIYIYMYSGFYNENILKSRLDIVGLGFLANQLGTALRKGATHIGIDSTVLCGHQIVATAAEDRQRI